MTPRSGERVQEKNNYLFISTPWEAKLEDNLVLAIPVNGNRKKYVELFHLDHHPKSGTTSEDRKMLKCRTNHQY